jgi:hypothetical protein
MKSMPASRTAARIQTVKMTGSGDLPVTCPVDMSGIGTSAVAFEADLS